MKSKIISIILAVICVSTIHGQNAPNPHKLTDIIPKPQKEVLGEGEFFLTDKVTISYASEDLKNSSDKFQSYINEEFGLKLKSKRSPQIQTAAINLFKDNSISEEGYILEVTSQHVVCKASTEAGFFYGLQSLLQLKQNGNKLPAITIEDYPQQGWRGFMLDESRSFFGKEAVLQYLEVMARMKMNVFHWHLTDDSGWRIEIKKYPNLTVEGAKGNWSDRNAPISFYTQEEVKEIVKFAADRHIMVIPEIDMPGHATAAARSYPEISGGGEGRWEHFTFNPAKEATYEFINDVFDEIVELFPAPYIHIGGDEVHYGNQSWFTDPQIQQFIKDKGLKNELELEHYFVRRACDIVNSKGKTMIGWDEIVNTGVNPEKAVIMWWRHEKMDVLADALKKGFKVVAAPRIPCYFNFVQHDSHKVGRRKNGEYTELNRTYNLPGFLEFPIIGYEKQILGYQACLWTPQIVDRKRLEFMSYPRLLALAEVSWQKVNLDYPNFAKRVKVFFNYLDKKNIYYFNLFDPQSTPEPWGPDTQDVIANG